MARWFGSGWLVVVWLVLLGVPAVWAEDSPGPEENTQKRIETEARTLWRNLHEQLPSETSWTWFEAQRGQSLPFGLETQGPVGLRADELAIHLSFRDESSGERLRVALQRRDDEQPAYERTARYNVFYETHQVDRISAEGVAFLKDLLKHLSRVESSTTALLPKAEAERILAERRARQEQQLKSRWTMVPKDQVLRREGVLWGVVFSLLLLLGILGTLLAFPYALKLNEWYLSSRQAEQIMVLGVLLPIVKALVVVGFASFFIGKPANTQEFLGSFWSTASLYGEPSSWLAAYFMELVSWLPTPWNMALLYAMLEILTVFAVLIFCGELFQQARIIHRFMLLWIVLPWVLPHQIPFQTWLLLLSTLSFLAGFLLYTRRLETRHLILSLGYGGLLAFVQPWALLGMLFLVPLLGWVNRHDQERLLVVLGRVMPWAVLLICLLLATPVLQQELIQERFPRLLDALQHQRMLFVVWLVLLAWLVLRKQSTSRLFRGSLAAFSLLLVGLSFLLQPVGNLLAAMFPALMLTMIPQEESGEEDGPLPSITPTLVVLMVGIGFSWWSRVCG